MNNILFVISIQTHFLEFKRFYKASINRQYDTFNIKVCFNKNYPNIENDIKFCKDHEIVFNILEPILTNVNETNISAISFIKNRKFFINEILLNILRTVKYYFRYNRIKETYKNLLIKNNINLLLICEDNVSYHLNIFTILSNKLKIPVYVFPFTIPNFIEFAEQVKDEYIFQSNIISYFKFKIFDKWIINYNSKKLYRLPIWEIIAIELNNLSPTFPWIQYAEPNLKIIVENSFMFNKYLNLGINEKNLFQLGTLIDDEMYSIHKNSINNKIILCAFPPPQIHYNSNFKNYNEIIDFLVLSLSKLDKNKIVVKLHPRTPDFVKSILSKNNIMFSDEETYLLLSKSYCYIAFASATIRWALNINIKILNYDIYGYNYNDFDNCKNVINITTKEEFLLQIADLSQKDFSIENLQSEFSFPLDGRSSDRIFNFINNRL